MNADQIAQVAKTIHQVNKVYCESMGDDSQKDWDETSEEIKESVVHGIEFHLKNPEATALDSHNNWMEKKVADGWTYGHIKDPVKKEHPCILEYDRLPIVQKTKDELFIAVVKSFI